MSEELTPVFDGSVKPVHVGVYRTLGYYSFFDGQWHGEWASVRRAYEHRGFPPGPLVSGWCGLATPPKGE